MKTSILMLALVLTLVANINTSQAELVPKLINYQGKLTEAKRFQPGKDRAHTGEIDDQFEPNMLRPQESKWADIKT